MDEKAREGNYYSLSNLASQSIIMFFFWLFLLAVGLTYGQSWKKLKMCFSCKGECR